MDKNSYIKNTNTINFGSKYQSSRSNKQPKKDKKYLGIFSMDNSDLTLKYDKEGKKKLIAEFEKALSEVARMNNIPATIGINAVNFMSDKISFNVECHVVDQKFAGKPKYRADFAKHAAEHGIESWLLDEFVTYDDAIYKIIGLDVNKPSKPIMLELLYENKPPVYVSAAVLLKARNEFLNKK